MNRANQQALFQATNQGLLHIRQSEINYYQSLNVAFGTQAALIGKAISPYCMNKYQYVRMCIGPHVHISIRPLSMCVRASPPPAPATFTSLALAPSPPLTSLCHTITVYSPHPHPLILYLLPYPLGGFTYGIFTQNPVNDELGYSVEGILDVYWTVSSLTIALSVHVVLCTMLMQVLGPGLALNGPIGSVARATEGMRIEQKQIIVSFVAMMLTFAVSTVLSFWVVMSFAGALSSTACFVVASYYWWKYCERIWL
jgi:hypothetical protein